MKTILLAVNEAGNKYFKRTLYSFSGTGCASNRNSFVSFIYSLPGFISLSWLFGEKLSRHHHLFYIAVFTIGMSALSEVLNCVIFLNY